ncbi:phosphotransferase family protein [Acidimangrovimonas sediminis]|uniref:phosphotransferase family protein n=1 Tax=Acidimangrovimonas sediminis TaxID=2056283 RepID=UPI000C80F0CD|nr:phosphotransferase family protein [Acidimangrovimonas sediminis]
MMTDTQSLDLVAVSHWLEGHLPGFRGPVTAQKFDTGQSNPTFRLQTSDAAYVLRRKPPGKLLKSAHAVDREFRVQRALAETEVPVAKMHLLCEDDSVIGSAFYIMEWVDGRNFDDPSLPGMEPADRAAIFAEMNRVLAAIHKVDLKLTGLDDYGPEGSYYRRQIDRWTKQYRASETEAIPAMDELIAWLDANAPEDDGRRTLVHGDYRIDNMLFSREGPACLAVLDWELSTTGHPFADLASVIMQWQRPPGREGRGLAGLDRRALGLPSDEAFIASYCERMGIPGIPRFGFYLAFCAFRMAAILQGVKKRALDGNASSPERALKIGAYVPQFAEGGLEAAKSV